jgi:hypothetical protein
VLIVPEVRGDQREKAWFFASNQQYDLIWSVHRYIAQEVTPGPKGTGMVVGIMHMRAAAVY